jgi:hypothetical protein
MIASNSASGGSGVTEHCFVMFYVPHVWLTPPVEEVPCCPDCRAEYERTRELGGMSRIPAELRGQTRSRQPQRFIEGKQLMSHSQPHRYDAALPSDYPLGSPESRAAARMPLEHQRESDIPAPARRS